MRELPSELTAVVRAGAREEEPADADASISEIVELATYPPELAGRLDEAWAYHRLGAVSTRQAVTPRQATILAALRSGIVEAREEMSSRGYSPDRIVAIAKYLGLAASDLVVLLCTAATWHDGRFRDGLARNEWSFGPTFAEAGGALLERRWDATTASITDAIAANVELRADTTVIAADMTNLPVGSDAFELTIWDPPYYDNIDYDRLAGPWTNFLRRAIGELDPSLPWPEDKSERSTDDSTFNTQAYESSIVAAANEIVRVSAPGARLVVYWVTREPGQLDSFISLLQPCGLELTHTVRVNAGAAYQGTAQPYMLAFQILKGVPANEARGADADRVLELTEGGAPVLYAGITEILKRLWDPDDLEELLQSSYQGSLDQRLWEYVACSPDPSELLTELGRRDLREEAVRLGADAEELAGLDVQALARLITLSLGFNAPEPPAFSIEAALRRAIADASALRIASTPEDIKGHGLSAMDHVERVLKFSVACWCSVLSADDWTVTAAGFLGDGSTQDVDGLTLGQWKDLFASIPKDAGGRSEVIGRASRLIKQQKVVAALDELVGYRNRLAHPKRGQDWAELAGGSIDAITDLSRRMDAVIQGGGLPRVLQPIDETRDRFGRLRTRLVDHDDREVEIIVTEPMDLTRPVVLLRSNANPREVDPVLLDFHPIEDRLGLRT